MDNVVILESVEKRLSEYQAGRKNSGGGGSGMEQRIGRLEDKVQGLEDKVQGLDGKVEKLNDSVQSLREAVAKIEGKISMLPGYPGIATIMAIVGGALLIVSRLFPAAPP